MGYYGQTEELIRRSGAEARLLGHSYVGSVHLLLALCQMSGGTAQLLRSFGIEPEFLRQLIMLLYGVGRAELPLPQCGRPGGRVSGRCGPLMCCLPWPG